MVARWLYRLFHLYTVQRCSENTTQNFLTFILLKFQCHIACQNVSSTTLPEDQSCSISVSESVSRLDSVSLTVSTPGQNCSFNVTSLDGEAESTECRGREEEEGSNYLGTNQLGVEDRGDKVVGDVFTCVLDHLEPGTVYQLQIQSQTDNETANLTLHTSKSSSRHTTYTLDNTFSTQGHVLGC